jgi:hypothetical protein
MMVAAVAAVSSLVAAVGHLLHIVTFSVSVCQVDKVTVFLLLGVYFRCFCASHFFIVYICQLSHLLNYFL